MNQHLVDQIRRTIARVPDWLRRDLSSKDEGTRQQAEEAITAMILSAISSSPEE